ncbi:uncharacterized protein LOC135372266 [Ornithodoros turicata]|uniref:uncharacterized protein LOC135372266 n=1 Tax=Ornithodoros turicata TaxID=34597 RepID=UPI00313A2823
MKSLVRGAPRDRKALLSPDGDTDHSSATQRDQALRDAQASVISSISPLVALLERCADREPTAQDDVPSGQVERRVIADHLAATISHLGRLFTCLGNERRDNILGRIAPDLRSLGSKDPQPEDEGTSQLFGQRFLDQLRTRNETFRVFKEARQEPTRQPMQEPAAKRPRTAGGGPSTFRRQPIPFPGRPFPGGFQGRAPPGPRGRGRV